MISFILKKCSKIVNQTRFYSFKEYNEFFLSIQKKIFNDKILKHVLFCYFDIYQNEKIEDFVNLSYILYNFITEGKKSLKIFPNIIINDFEKKTLKKNNQKELTLFYCKKTLKCKYMKIKEWEILSKVIILLYHFYYLFKDKEDWIKLFIINKNNFNIVNGNLKEIKNYVNDSKIIKRNVFDVPFGKGNFESCPNLFPGVIAKDYKIKKNLNHFLYKF